MNRVLIGALGLVVATPLTACGSSHTNGAATTNGGSTATPTTPAASATANTGGSGAEGVKALIKAEILKSQAGNTANPFHMGDAQASCTANAVVDAIGVDKLHSYGLLTADNKLTSKKFTATRFSVADATAVVNALFSCVGNANFTTLMKREISARLPATLPTAQRACIESKITVDAVKRVIIAELSGQTGAGAQFTASVEACMAR